MATESTYESIKYHGVDQELQAISCKIFTISMLLDKARDDDFLFKGLRELLTTVSHKVQDLSVGRLPYELLPCKEEQDIKLAA